MGTLNIESKFLYRVDSLLSCLLHRHKSAMVRIGELDEVRELASETRRYTKQYESDNKALNDDQSSSGNFGDKPGVAG